MQGKTKEVRAEIHSNVNNPDVISFCDQKEEIDEDQTVVNIENDLNFAEAVKNNSKKLKAEEDDSRKLDPKTNERKEEVCKYYRRGQCKFGFSGLKKNKDGETCGWSHPKVCEKLFRYGFHPVKGCKGKEAGCEDFHPKVCGNSFKGKCEDECQSGFHLRSIVKYAEKRKNTKKDDNEVKEIEKDEKGK